MAAWASEPGMQRPADIRLLSWIQVLGRTSNSAFTLDGLQSLADNGGKDINLPSSPCPRRPRAPPGLDPFPHREEATAADAHHGDWASRARLKDAQLTPPTTLEGEEAANLRVK